MKENTREAKIDAFNVTVIDLRNGIDDQSSNLYVAVYLSLCAIALVKDMNSSVLTSPIGKLKRTMLFSFV